MSNIPLPLLFLAAFIILLLLFGLSYWLTVNQERLVKGKTQEPEIDIDRENLRNLMGDNTK